MENYYNTLAKKYIPKQHNPGFGKTHNFQSNFRAVIIGPSGVGKSNCVINLIKALNGTFTHIHLCLKNADEPLYQMLADKLGEDLTIYEDGNVPLLRDLTKEQQLIIFDDLVNDKNANKEIEEYFKMGRKKHISCVYLSQSFYKTPKFIRQQLSHIIIKKINSARDLNLILSEFPMNISKDELKRLYSECTKNFTDVMTIDLVHGHIYHNFTNQLA